MKIRKIIHKNVDQLGNTPDGTNVLVQGGIRYGNENILEGHWIAIFFPRTDEGIVECTCCIFNDQYEMSHFVNNKELTKFNFSLLMN
jgi:hypothetical protein